MKKTVKEIYKNNHSAGRYEHILPINTGYSWWEEYEANVNVFDRAFATRFASFTYEPVLDDPENINELVTAFTDDVEAIFAKNAKKYEELYRIHTISDTDLPVSYNYDMREVMARTTSDQSAVITGQRTDINNVEIGNQKQSNLNKVTGYNSDNESTNNSQSSELGSRNDVTQFTKGQETDTTTGTGTEDYTLTRKGNIGVQTGADIARIFTDFWQNPKALFYNTIFDDICMELLQIGW